MGGYVLGVLMGIALGIGLAYFLTVTLVKRSNDIGDSSGKLSDFGTLHMITSEDGLSAAKPSGRGEYILKEQLQKEKEWRG
jgi:hypothetical protein